MHQERRKAHYLRSRSAHHPSGGGSDEGQGPPEEKKIGIDPVVKDIGKEEVRIYEN